MLNKIAPLALVVALGLGSAASAATVTGTVANIDTVNDSVTLTDGTSFDFNNKAYAERLVSFKAGDKVAVSYHHVGTSLEANAISPVAAANTAAVVSYPEHAVDHY